MKYSARWYFLRWLCGAAYLVDGMAIVVSMGFWNPALSLWAEAEFLDETDRMWEKDFER